MTPGYFHNCTFFAVFRSQNNGEHYTHTLLHFMEEPAESPKEFFNWVQANTNKIQKTADTGTAVLVIECKVIEPVTSYFYEFSNQ